MAEQTTDSEMLDREAAADRLNDIASALSEGDDFSVRVGNKEIDLHPTREISYRIDVIERKARWRGSRETIQIELDWKPE